MTTATPAKRPSKRTSLTDTVKAAETARQAVESDATPPAPVPEAPAPAAVMEAPARKGGTAGRLALGTAGALIGSAGVQTLLGASLLTFGGGLALGIFAGVAAADRYLGKSSR